MDVHLNLLQLWDAGERCIRPPGTPWCGGIQGHARHARHHRVRDLLVGSLGLVVGVNRVIFPVVPPTPCGWDQLFVCRKQVSFIKNFLISEKRAWKKWTKTLPEERRLVGRASLFKKVILTLRKHYRCPRKLAEVLGKAQHIPPAVPRKGFGQGAQGVPRDKLQEVRPVLKKK